MYRRRRRPRLDPLRVSTSRFEFGRLRFAIDRSQEERGRGRDAKTVSVSRSGYDGRRKERANEERVTALPSRGRKGMPCDQQPDTNPMMHQVPNSCPTVEAVHCEDLLSPVLVHIAFFGACNVHGLPSGNVHKKAKLMRPDTYWAIAHVTCGHFLLHSALLQ